MVCVSGETNGENDIDERLGDLTWVRREERSGEAHQQFISTSSSCSTLQVVVVVLMLLLIPNTVSRSCPTPPAWISRSGCC